MATTYKFDHSEDIASVVRLLVRDGSGTPTAGLSVSYIVRDATGASIASGVLTDLPGAPGWYFPTSFVLSITGTYTIEYSIPATFAGESDAIIQILDLPARSYIQDVAFIDRNYRFNLFFTNKDNAPLTVTTPEIEIYHYDSLGVRTVLTPANEPLSLLTPPETGRYIYDFMVPATFVEGDLLYAEVIGLDPTPDGLGLIRFDYLLSLRAVVSDRLGTKFVQ